jgi:hypothetical protein
MKIGAVVNQVAEWSYHTTRNYGDREEQIDVDVRITAPGNSWVVPAYWAGEGEWRLRFSPPAEGHYKTTSLCSDETNPDLHGVQHELAARAYAGERLLVRRGPVRISGNGPRFEHADGTPFFWLGDTWWMAVTERLKWPEDFQALTEDRRRRGFSVVQLVIGFLSDMAPYDPRGKNEGGYPWTPGFQRINPRFFDAADLKIRWLVREGLVPCILGGWGYVGLQMEEARIKRHWRYLVARYAAYPVVWALAGETMMPWYFSEDRESDSERQREIWSQVARYVRDIDPYGRPMTTHPRGRGRGLAEVASPELLDFEMVQGGQNGHQDLETTAALMARAVVEAGPRPAVMGEACYEGIRGGSREEVQRFLFWSSILSGAAGFTYGANGIWQVNQKDALFGLKPNGMSPGDTTWDEACGLAGARQIGLGRRFLERYPWWQLRPRQDLVRPAAGEGDWRQAYCGAVSDHLRVVYLPGPVHSRTTLPILSGLRLERDYAVLYFDPASGNEYDMGTTMPDEGGRLQAPQPRIMQDWVLVVRARG